MSRHPSPGPSSQPSHHPPSVPARQKQPKPYAIGIAAGAEDVKYQTKYKELKRKVKDIEADNDKLHFKVLQAKRSIQRMKVERAVLYERLSSSTPPPDLHDRHAPQPLQHPGQVSYQQPIRGHPGNVQHRETRDHPPPGDDLAMAEYMRPQANSRAPPSDTRHLPPVDYSIGPGAVASPHMVHSPRRTSSGHDGPRQLPPLQQLSSIPIEIPRTHSLPPSYASPSVHHSHVSPSNERSRPHPSSHSRGHQQPSQPYVSGLNQPPYSDGRTTQHAHSPSLAERERPIRHDVHEMNEPRSLTRHQTPVAQHSPSLHSADTRSSSHAMHNHQRMGSAVYSNREEPHERQQDPEREREWSRSREFGSSHGQSPSLLHRSHSALERGEHPEHHLPPRVREDPTYYHESPSGPYPIHQRPDSPGSRSGSGDLQRPDNYENERSRPYRLRPVSQEDVEYRHPNDGRSLARDLSGSGGGTIPVPPQEPTRAAAEIARKRSRNEMDVDSDPEAEITENSAGRGAPANPAYIGGRLSDDRSVKRYHLPRNIDNHEDSRMGPL